MLRFEREQNVFEIGGVKVGGQPGDAARASKLLMHAYGFALSFKFSQIFHA